MVNLVQRVLCIAVLEESVSVVVPVTRGKDPGNDIQTPDMLWEMIMEEK